MKGEKSETETSRQKTAVMRLTTARTCRALCTDDGGGEEMSAVANVSDLSSKEDRVYRQITASAVITHREEVFECLRVSGARL